MNKSIQIKKILVVIKKTKYELDLEKYKDVQTLKKICAIQNNCFDKVYESHLRQIESRELLQKELSHKVKFIQREELDTIDQSSYDLIVSLGGDNHFTYIAHHAKILIAGCNSDVKTSVGALLNFSPITFIESYNQSWQNNAVEEWSLIEAVLTFPNNLVQTTVKAVNEISLRNNSPDLTSRYIIDFNGHIEEQKSSGLLFYTGAGSTGWYQSCKHDDNESEIFSRNAPYFKAYTRELSRKARTNFKLTDFMIENECKIISEMNGGISIDSLPERVYDFPPGTIVHIQLSKEKLRVLR